MIIVCLQIDSPACTSWRCPGFGKTLLPLWGEFCRLSVKHTSLHHIYLTVNVTFLPVCHQWPRSQGCSTQVAQTTAHMSSFSCTLPPTANIRYYMIHHLWLPGHPDYCSQVIFLNHPRSWNVAKLNVFWFCLQVSVRTSFPWVLAQVQLSSFSFKCADLPIHLLLSHQHWLKLIYCLWQILRFCGPMVPVYTAVTLLLTCGGQLSSILKSKRVADRSHAVCHGLQPHKVSLPVYILHVMLRYGWED